METVLVTGAEGLLAPHLISALARRYRTVSTARRAGDVACDLLDADAVKAMIERVRPDIVVHAAAMTNVDRCELQPDVAIAGNVTITRHLRQTLPPTAKLVYISTDQVYPNTPGPHREGSEDPANEYGRTKLAGERVASESEAALIVRTNLFGPSTTPSRASLSDFVANSLRAERPITLFRDVWFSPLHMTTLAGYVRDMIGAGLRGVYNLGSRQGLTKAEFGLAVAAQLQLPIAGISIGRSSDVPARAPRPLDLRLDVHKVEAALGCEMPSCLAEITKL